MPEIVMADVWGGEFWEAEPVIVDGSHGVVEFTLDDGTIVRLDRARLLAALPAEREAA